MTDIQHEEIKTQLRALRAQLADVRSRLAVSNGEGDSFACDDEGRILLFAGKPVVDIDDPSLPPIAHYMAIAARAQRDLVTIRAHVAKLRGALEAVVAWSSGDGRERPQSADVELVLDALGTIMRTKCGNTECVGGFLRTFPMSFAYPCPSCARVAELERASSIG